MANYDKFKGLGDEPPEPLPPMSLGSKVLRGFMMFNGVVDLVAPLYSLFTGKAGIWAEALPSLATNALALRMSSWAFFMAAAPRFVSGALAFTSGGAPLAVDALAMYSYAGEMLMFAGEVYIFKTTTLQVTITCFVLPMACCLGLASRMIATAKLSKD